MNAMFHQIPPKYKMVILCYGTLLNCKMIVVSTKSFTKRAKRIQTAACTQSVKYSTAGSPSEDKHRASQGPFPLFCMPEAPSYTVNQEACVTDGLFSSHKHGTPLETAHSLFPLSSILHKALQLALPTTAQRQSSPDAAPEDVSP